MLHRRYPVFPDSSSPDCLALFFLFAAAARMMQPLLATAASSETLHRCVDSHPTPHHFTSPVQTLLYEISTVLYSHFVNTSEQAHYWKSPNDASDTVIPTKKYLPYTLDCACARPTKTGQQLPLHT